MREQRLTTFAGPSTICTTGAPGAVPGSDDEARARLGDYFAEVLLIDQGTDAARAKIDLGWSPSHRGLVDELRDGSYSSAAQRS